MGLAWTSLGETHTLTHTQTHTLRHTDGRTKNKRVPFVHFVGGSTLFIETSLRCPSGGADPKGEGSLEVTGQSGSP